MASIAVLPVLIGLAVDYAIQLQARYDEAVGGGAPRGRGGSRRGRPGRAGDRHRMSGHRSRVRRPAALAEPDGARLRPDARGRDRGRLRAGADRRVRRPQPPPRGPARGAEPRRRRSGSPRSARRSVAGARSALAVAIASPGRVLVVGLALALCGWVAGTRTETISDVRELVPQDLAQVRDLNQLQDTTGVSGELDVSVQTPDIADPALVRWMGEFKQRVLEANGFDGRFPSCREGPDMPWPGALGLPRPARGSRSAGPDQGAPRPVARLRPAGGPRLAIPAPGSSTRPSSPSGSGPVARRPAGADRPRPGRDRPARQPATAPRRASRSGWPACPSWSPNRRPTSPPAATGSPWPGLSRWRWCCSPSTARRRGRSCPLMPIVLATGWSSLVLAATGIPLNPMSATLGALVIAIATEFSVILSARYHEERGGGLGRRGAAPCLLAHRGGGARLGRHGDRRLRRADRRPTSGCCATSASSPCSTCRRPASGVLLVLPGGAGLGGGLVRDPRRLAAAAAGRPAASARRGAEPWRPGAEATAAPMRPAAASRAPHAGAGAEARGPLLAFRRPRLPRADRRRHIQHADHRDTGMIGLERSTTRPAAARVRGAGRRRPARGRRQHLPGRLRDLAESLSRATSAAPRPARSPAPTRSGSATTSTGRW